MKYKKIMPTALLIFVLFIVGYFLHRGQMERADLKVALEKNEKFYTWLSVNELNKNNSSVESIYYYVLIKKDIIDDSERKLLLSMADSSFIKECKNPSKCSPYHTLAPYCMFKKASKGVFPEEFYKALEYWANYFKENSIEVNNMKAFYGYLVAETNCGSAEKIKTTNLLEKIFEFNQNALYPEEKISILPLKFKIIRKFHLLGMIKSDSKLESAKKSVCALLPTLNLKNAGICDIYNYYETKVWCEADLSDLTHEEQLLLKNIMETELSEIKDIACQKQIARLLTRYYLKEQV